MKAIFIVCLIMLSSAVSAVPITGLFNTGVDNSGTALPNGSTDSHYLILETAASAIVVNPNAAWIPNDLVSKWIWQTISGQPINVTRTFQTTVDLTGFDLNTVAISGRWSTDNFGRDIVLNGARTSQTAGGFSFWTNFSLNSGFVPGINTIDFIVQDVGVVSGFRAEISGQGELLSAPEPTTLALISLGVLGIWRINRRVL